MCNCIGITIDSGVHAGGLRTVDNLSCREDSRCQQLPCALPLRCCENHARAGAGIVDRGCAHCQLLDLRPVLLGNQIAPPLRTMCVGIDQSGHNRFTRNIDNTRTGRDGNVRYCSNGRYPVAGYDDRPVFNCLRPFARHRQNARACEDGRARGPVCPDCHGKADAAGRRRETCRIIFRRRCGKHCRSRGPVECRPHRPVERFPALRPVDVIRPALAHFRYGQRTVFLGDIDDLAAGHQRHSECFVILAKRKIPPVG